MRRPVGSEHDRSVDADRARLRLTFEEVAELYDLARPLYPAELFDDLVALTALGPGDRIVAQRR